MRITFAAILIPLSACGQKASHPALISASLSPVVPVRDFVEAQKGESGFQISPDGKRIAWDTFDGAEPVVAVKRLGQEDVVLIDGGFDRLKWSADSRYLMLWREDSGDIFVADCDSSAAPRSVTRLSKGAAYFVGYSSKAASAVYVQHNGRDERVFDLYLLDLVTGKMKLVAENPGNVAQWLVHDDVVRARVEQKDSARYLVVLSQDPRQRSDDDSAWRTMASWSLADTTIPIGFDRGGNALWVVSNVGDDKVGLRKLDLVTGAMQAIFADPQVDLDAESLPLMGPKTNEPLSVASEPDFPSIHVFHEGLAKCLENLGLKGPARITVLSVDSEENLATVKVFDSAGTKHYLLRMNSGKAELLAEDYFSRAPSAFAPSTPIEFMSRDGIKLHGYLTRPIGILPGAKLPMVVRVHGGPWYRNIWGDTDLAAASTQVQFLANRGYAVLEINFRGSTGYGRKFQDAAIGEFGRKMQYDVIDGVRWAIQQGIADPEHVAIMGASYGGYAALMALAQYPETFTCGIAASAPTDLAKMIEGFPEVWALEMHLWYRFVGNPAIPTDRAAMMAISPISHALELSKPLLLIHGLRDPLIDAGQASALAAALKRKGKPVTYLQLGDEGHTISGFGSQRAMYAEMEDFLAPCLGGRTAGFDYRSLFGS